MGDRRRGVLLAAGGVLAISTDSLFTRLADTTAFDVIFWIGILTAVVVLSIAFLRGHAPPTQQLRHDAPLLLLAAVLQSGSLMLFVLAVKNTSVANVVTIVAAAPLAAAAISWALIGERTSARVWSAILVSAAGIGIVISGSLGGGNLGGDLLAAGAIVSFGCAMTLLRRHPGLSRTMIVGLGGLVMAAIAAWPATFSGYDLSTWLALVGMGAIVGPLGRVMVNLSSRYLPPAEVAMFLPLETICATLWAFLLLGETPAGRTWIGGAVVLVGLLWAITAPPASPRPVEALDSSQRQAGGAS